ncbi:MAG: class I SAM-dependent methyltransferase [Deltaproteobacteria bacterium]|nr:class I SAM-dependent methyltransferase [Deltaproteobacteria bacterium]
MPAVTLFACDFLPIIPSSVYVPLLDRLLFRHAFRGDSARRYALDERPAFGDLDDRLLAELDLAGARRLLDLGCGPGTFARAAAARHPGLTVIAMDPSRDFAGAWDGPAAPNVHRVQGWGEAIPLADASVDVAMCLSSIRHVRDRARTLRELRRTVRDRLVIVELDPDADAARIAAHADALGGPTLRRRMFGPLVVKTAPPAPSIAELARAAGFTQVELRPDRIQPVYVMQLR